MIEAKYFKDYKHNYMILKCEDMGTGENYHRRMLANNKIDGILKCSVRNINGAAYFYYDISSKVTLENLYHGKKMSYEQVRDFFSQIDTICRNLGQFFMEERGLLLQPDCIFYDFTSKKYFGLYYLMKDIQSENPYEQLMDFLLNHTDTGNQKLADVVYQIYELSESPSFSIADALLLFDESGDASDTAMDVNHECMPVETNAGKEAVCEPFMECMRTNDRNYSGIDDSEDESYISEHAANNEKKETGVKNRIYYAVFAVISLCGIGAVLWIYNSYELTQYEFMMTLCCMAVMGLCLVFSASQVILSGKKIRKKEQEERELLRDIEDEFRDEGAVALQEVLDKNMSADVYEDYSISNIPASDERQRANENRKRKGDPVYAQEEWHGNFTETIFMDAKKPDTEYKLYALDNRNKKHIELTKFPFTIGKMAGCADCVLTDSSISRLHARIEKQDDQILLTDMNSTNGTYKNGLRMQPGETVEIEPGDEIRFGKLNYCYR